MSIIETLREKRAQKAKMDKEKEERDKAKAEKILKEKADAEIAKKILKEMKASNISSFNEHIKDVCIQLKDLSKKSPDVLQIDFETFNDCKALAEKYALPITTQVLRGDVHHQSCDAFNLFSHLIKSYYHDICEDPENKVIIDEIIGERPSDEYAKECADYHRDRGRYFKFSPENPWPRKFFFFNFPLFFSFEASDRYSDPERRYNPGYLDSDYLLQFTFDANNILHLDEYIRTYKGSINYPVRFRKKLRRQLVQKLIDSPIVNENRFYEELHGDFYRQLIGDFGRPHPFS